MSEAEEEYCRLLRMGLGLPAIVKMLDIPPLFVSKRYSEGGLYTEPYVIEKIGELLEKE